ncbi:hypothetical protein [Cellulomonas sp. KH9]|uniref:hypothetical protein n=1 Tax=Cellulomonas sp. KH9 TaxID=1855324 RepID=UPI0008F13B54|nr:hypothetical protein [Cellulomonas sp. KH9]SFJ75227.1 hypothetical protein SAMN05216467_0794 [Cellulomonas sp. KH9]
MSHLVETDLRTSPTDRHFTGPPSPLHASLVARRDGCVAVVVDGVTRIPVWPDGTTVEQDVDDLQRYIVTLPGGTELVARPTDGDEFTADGVVVDATEPFTDPIDPPSLVTTFLGFCAVDAAPVLFADETTFSVTR